MNFLLALLVAAVAVASPSCPPWAQPSRSQSSAACRCLPGDKCWPSASTWEAFNATIGGRLIATVPLAAPCHGSALSSSACAALRASWFTPNVHTESPSSIMAPYFTNNSCNPFLPPEAPCIVGSYVSYTVNVSEPLDISRTIWFATYFNIRLVIKNTGHDYNGKSTGAGAIGIWTHHLKTLAIIDYRSANYTGKAIRVGAGVQMMDAYSLASANRLAIVGGEASTVGYAGGYTQGAGHSSLASRYGLAADQVLEWELVDGRGRILKATPSLNPDLYWALSGGGGGTYGVVTSMTSKAYPDVPVVGAKIAFTNAGITQDRFYELMSVFQASLPDMVDAGAMAIWFFNSTFFSLSPLTAPGLKPEKVEQLLSPLRKQLKAFNVPHAYSVETFPGYLPQFKAQITPTPVGVGQYGARFIPRSVVQEKNVELTAAYRYMVEHGALVAGLGIKVSHSVTGNVWNSVNPAWRDTLIHNVIQTPYNYTAPLSDMKKAQDQITHDLLPPLERLTPGGGAYMNEGDWQQPDWQHVFYGSNYAALAAIKNTYDPFHAFYATTAVGSEYWAPQADGRLCKT
ncbi:hypothetical protein CDD81_4039 [Ophiocordyceps australis]|uniref:FAD-binding PCMH-type domain-containing protein n=1 Tax=Ophiocordyceps australis TaxID=1399860 RepID=A0A2C5Y7U5_9HYPO|nr:hypothetical protein CDD81_4039 [Ophiocordyceps australis]